MTQAVDFAGFVVENKAYVVEKKLYKINIKRCLKSSNRRIRQTGKLSKLQLVYLSIYS